jgi:hypothetical protein
MVLIRIKDVYLKLQGSGTSPNSTIAMFITHKNFAPPLSLKFVGNAKAKVQKKQ